MQKLKKVGSFKDLADLASTIIHKNDKDDERQGDTDHPKLTEKVLNRLKTWHKKKQRHVKWADDYGADGNAFNTCVL